MYYRFTLETIICFSIETVFGLFTRLRGIWFLWDLV